MRPRSLFTALAFVSFGISIWLLLTLGFWQLSRAEEKQRVLDQTHQAAQADYSELYAFPADHTRLDYQTVRLRGAWQSAHQFLLANRIYQGRLGFEVLTPFRLFSGDHLLVNRGWIPAESTVPVVDEQAAAEGVLYAPEQGYQLGEAIVSQTMPPTAGARTSTDNIVLTETLYLDLPAISSALGTPLLPSVLVMETAPDNTLVRIWQPINVQPERHIAYAVQWFGLALALLVFGVIWLRKFKTYSKKSDV